MKHKVTYLRNSDEPHLELECNCGWSWRGADLEVWLHEAQVHVVRGEFEAEEQAVSYDTTEQDKVIAVFSRMLWEATKDGGKKRARGEKPPWYKDFSHEPAIFSHLSKWKHGELVDADSGAHPLVHLAWRALAIAYQQTYGYAEPVMGYSGLLNQEVEAQPAKEPSSEEPADTVVVES